MKFPRPAVLQLLICLALQACAPAEPERELPFPSQLERLDPEVRARLEAAREPLRQAPDSADAWRHLGMTFEAHSFMELAIECYRAAAELEPSARTQHRLAIALAAQGDLEAALQAIELALDLQPDSAPSHLLRGSFLFDLARFDEAFDAYALGRQVDPAHLGGALGMARVELQRAAPEAAIRLLEENLEQKPKEPSTRRLLHAAYLQAGQPQKAASLTVRWHSFPSLGADPMAREFAAYASPPVMERAGLELQRGNWQAAVELLEPFVQQNPHESNARAHLAWAYQLGNRGPEALELIHSSLEQAPRDLLLLAMRARLLEVQGQPARALEVCASMLEIEPEHLAALEQRARLFLQLDKPLQAIEAYQEVLQLDRSRMQLWLSLGDAQMQAELWSEAAASYAAALELKPGAEAPFLGARRVQWRLGDLAGAHAALSRRKNLGPEGRLLLQEMSAALALEGDA